ncbi:hypothetical protein BSR29_05405 [Boudabousia liubingyangii]|uniref:Thioredoxin-like fold domain-containing protein n=1 Tax=Boudabousia liubingyangii TaxID=1921764 RepID=A0A1Q5PLJ7_9ACTO|nr:thioredoxin domain-containing protein [Boudabousia liubingyangii]OKL47920.1 hypothetical protein BSR29_05405 [Boudabousia liubingyangii]
MAKQGVQPTGGKQSIQARAAAMRAEAERKERRSKFIIWGVLGVVVAIAAALIVFAVLHKNSSEAGADSSPALSAGNPIVIGKEVGKPNEGKPVVAEYLSYSCPHCIHVGKSVQKPLIEKAQAGEITFELHPVATAVYPYTYVASAGAVIVANEEPAKFIKLNEALDAFFESQMNANDGSIVQDPTKSVEQVKSIAKQVGVSDAVVNKFSIEGGEAYLAKSSQAWTDGNYEGLDRKKGMGTPMFVVNGKYIPITALPENGPADVALIMKAVQEAAK